MSECAGAVPLPRLSEVHSGDGGFESSKAPRPPFAVARIVAVEEIWDVAQIEPEKRLELLAIYPGAMAFRRIAFTIVDAKERAA